MSKQNRTSNLSFLMLGLVILLCLSWVWQLNSQSERMEFSQVEQLFRQEKVESFVIRDNTLLMTLRGEPEGRNTLRYELYDFDLFYDSLGELVEEQTARGIIASYDYQQDHSTNWLEILLPFLLTAALIGGMGYLFLLRGQVGAEHLLHPVFPQPAGEAGEHPAVAPVHRHRHRQDTALVPLDPPDDKGGGVADAELLIQSGIHGVLHLMGRTVDHAVDVELVFLFRTSGPPQCFPEAAGCLCHITPQLW